MCKCVNSRNEKKGKQPGITRPAEAARTPGVHLTRTLSLFFSSSENGGVLERTGSYKPRLDIGLGDVVDLRGHVRST